MIGFVSYCMARLERQAVNRVSASDPAGLRMSDAKLRRLCPALYCSSLGGALKCLFYNGWGQRYYLRDMLVHGDSRAAVVVSVDPLLVACYSDDLDGVCLLRFDASLVADYGLKTGARLLTVLNTYFTAKPARRGKVAWDVVQGQLAHSHVSNFWPLVGEFLSDELDAIDARKQEIGEREYRRCRELGELHLRRFGGNARSGRPLVSMRPMPKREKA